MVDQLDPPRHSVSVTGVVFDATGHVLAIRRDDDGRWVPPGGILELSETPEDGLVREVREETGITVEPDSLIGIYKNMRLGVISLAFRCHAVAGEKCTTAEARQVEWLTVAQAAQMMPEARAIRVLDALRDDGPFIRTHDGTKLL